MSSIHSVVGSRFDQKINRKERLVQLSAERFGGSNTSTSIVAASYLNSNSILLRREGSALYCFHGRLRMSIHKLWFDDFI